MGMLNTTNAIIRFTTKMGMTARPDAILKTENLIGAVCLAKTILSTDNREVYTYSIEHKGRVHHYGADYHNKIGSNPA